MNSFKAYSFSRLIAHKDIEFFFIQGLIAPDDFDEHWDGTGPTVLGYLVMYKNHELKKLEYISYLLSNSRDNFSDIRRYTQQFANKMISAELESYDKKFEVKETRVKGDLVGPPYIDFVKDIVGNDIPDSVLSDIKV